MSKTTAGSMRQEEKIEKKREPVNINRKMYSKPKPSQQPDFFLSFVTLKHYQGLNITE